MSRSTASISSSEAVLRLWVSTATAISSRSSGLSGSLHSCAYGTSAATARSSVRTPHLERRLMSRLTPSSERLEPLPFVSCLLRTRQQRAAALFVDGPPTDVAADASMDPPDLRPLPVVDGSQPGARRAPRPGHAARCSRQLETAGVHRPATHRGASRPSPSRPARPEREGVPPSSEPTARGAARARSIHARPGAARQPPLPRTEGAAASRSSPRRPSGRSRRTASAGARGDLHRSRSTPPLGASQTPPRRSRPQNDESPAAAGLSVGDTGLEPVTSCLSSRRSPS